MCPVGSLSKKKNVVGQRYEYISLSYTQRRQVGRTMMSDVSSLEQRAWINPGISGYQVESLEDVIPTALGLTTDNSKEPGTQWSGLVWFIETAWASVSLITKQKEKNTWQLDFSLDHQLANNDMETYY